MILAAPDVVRVAEAVVGALLVVAVLVVAAVTSLRWLRRRGAERNAEPGTPALARVGGPLVDPMVFGGGHLAARSVRRRDTVTHGYLAVGEEYVSDDDLVHWCTLTVQLPGSVPRLVLDNREALDRAGAPCATGDPLDSGDARFDATYAAVAQSNKVLGRVVNPAVRALLIERPVQRLALLGNSVQIRDFDGSLLDDAELERLAVLAADFLARTPSFVTYAREPVAATAGQLAQIPLPPGFYGPDSEPGLP